MALRARLCRPPAAGSASGTESRAVTDSPVDGSGWIEVAAAVIEKDDGSFLLAQRPAGKVYAGWWEFPGGKCEPGETPAQALARELHEELGIEVDQAFPWITRTHVYPHGRVRLHFFRVPGWHGALQSREGQAFAWQRFPQLTVDPVLPANGPILKALSLPLVLGISQVKDLGAEEFLRRLDSALGRGLRFIQVREPALTHAALESVAREIVRRAHEASALVVLNGDPDLAQAIGADGVHLPARILAGTRERPGFRWVGASCHDREELERAQDLGLDYALAGPVLPTASHPGEPGIGWTALAEMVTGLELPIFAIGGLRPDHLHEARVAGAHGIAAIRSTWIPG
ncbi:MAG: Nudix family hydrolase [Betaproteobacteria bacterium]|nr:Nudix family hydrolase [Betaproteobacteria bacterium]